MSRSMSYADWLARCGCEGEDAERCTELLGDRVTDGVLTLDYILLKARRAG